MTELKAYFHLADIILKWGDEPSGNGERDDIAELRDRINAAGFAVAELPTGEEDYDGQTYFDGGDIRVDHTGPHGPEIWVSGHEVSQDVLRLRAAEFLAAARDAEVKS